MLLDEKSKTTTKKACHKYDSSVTNAVWQTKTPGAATSGVFSLITVSYSRLSLSSLSSHLQM